MDQYITDSPAWWEFEAYYEQGGSYDHAPELVQIVAVALALLQVGLLTRF